MAWKLPGAVKRRAFLIKNKVISEGLSGKEGLLCQLFAIKYSLASHER